VADWSGPLLRLLRVPPRPHLPAGDPGSARVFRAAPNFWRLQLLKWGFQQLVTLVGFLVFAGMLAAAPDTVEVNQRGRARPVPVRGILNWMRGLEALAVGVWVLQLPLTLALRRLDYELRWYVVTDRAARLREGIVSLTEMTFTLVNVQDIRIRQGPLQRALGLADVELRTAGGSEGPAAGAGHGQHGRNLHLARFSGVANAEEIRDLVLERMRRVRDAGLGDPDDPPSPAAAALSLEAVLHELRRESSALRHAVGA
jgi:PH (Pleckstrin Homology) domain-containing protein